MSLTDDDKPPRRKRQSSISKRVERHPRPDIDERRDVEQLGQHHEQGALGMQDVESSPNR